MKKILFYILLVAISLMYAPVSDAQIVDTGREVAKGTLDFSAMAAYLLIHPVPKVRQPIENDEDNDEQPPAPPAPPTKIFKRGALPFIPLSLLPASPAPTDTFESVLDPGTNIPPDTHGAVDLTYCMTTVNSAVKIQTRAGGAVSQVSLNAFWSSVTSGGTFDPRVHFDPYTNRWIVVAVCDADLSTSSILIAISKTNDPTGAWWTYKILADATGINWLDFPDVGYNGKWITVTGNLFANSGGAFNGAKVYVFNKASLLSGAGAPYTSFLQASDFTICPALTYDAATANMFLVQSYNGSNPSGGLMQLWKITGAVGSEAMTSVGFPQSAGFRWQQSSFQAAGPTPGADFAPQAGTSNLIQTNDDRVDQVVYMNGKLWFAHTVFLPYSSSVNPTRSSVQWWQIDTFGTPVQIGTIDDATNTNFYAFPTITPNSNDDALVGFAAFSATTFPSAAYALRQSGDAVDVMRPLQIYRHGKAKYYKTFSGTKNRWGDYSGACVDPVDMTNFWTIQEASSTPSGGNDIWDTWWAYVKLCSPPDAISGSASICVGATTTLSDDTLGGNWTTVNTTIATVGSGFGLVTGMGAGTASITYTLNGGCTVTKTVTVGLGAGAITGSTTVCTTLTTALTDAGGGTWISSNTTVATIGTSSGIVTGMSPGTSVITYTVGGGCTRTTTVTVSGLPGAITGTTTLCSGNTTALTDAGGGTWTSSNTIVATIGSSNGVVNGLSAGTSTIVYSLGAGCTASTTITVNTAPAAITGTASMCAGSSTALTDITPGGVWSSTNSSVATVVTGTVNGLTPGTSTISYTMSGSCSVTSVVTVNPMPGAITGATSLCQGLTTPLTDASPGGLWSSSNTLTAPVSGSGLVSGLSAGTATINYTLSGGCTVIANVTVNPSPSAITGTTGVCIGLTTPLSDATLLGAWTSSSTGVATVSGTGVVTGVSAGTATIVYTISGGCAATTVVTVGSSAPPITGATTICLGLTSNLTDASGGGTWSSSNTGIATVSGTGVVSGITTGSATITYTLGAGCTATTPVTVNLAAAPITGVTSVCNGATTALTDVTGGGAWTSSNTTIATVVSGLVTGMSTGTATINYLIGIGCSASTVVTVTPSPSAITGATQVCLGATTALTDAGGGTWTSSNTSVATIGLSSGLVTGVSTGTTLIAYTLAGCSATSTEFVNPLPSLNTVTGGGSFCAGGTGVHVGLGGSTIGINYELFNGLTLVTTLPGISTALDFGLQTGGGTYTVVAIDAVTGCQSNMAGSVTVTITPLATPSVSISAVPGDTICTGGHVTFTPVPLFGGAGPTYSWTKNSLPVSAGLTYTPLTTPNNLDIIVVTMTSNYLCLATPTAVSTPFVIHVEAPALNLDTIKVTQSDIVIGQTDTFVVIAPHAGTAPAYRWFLNSLPIPGATNVTYVTNTLANGDKVMCEVTSSDVCATPVINYSNSIKVQVSTGVSNVVTSAANLTLVPNPNKGEFTINGTLKNIDGAEVNIIVTDMVGQAIYKKTVQAHNGDLNEHIALPSSIANGTYLVKITSGTDPVVFRVVIDK